MRDYAQGYRPKMPLQVASRSHTRRVVVQPLRKLFWKTAGGVMVLAMCSGVMASFWIGHHIQSSLASIAALQKASAYEMDMQRKLVDERDTLLSTKRLMARAAVQNGLYQPSSKQKIGLRE